MCFVCFVRCALCVGVVVVGVVVVDVVVVVVVAVPVSVIVVGVIPAAFLLGSVVAENSQIGGGFACFYNSRSKKTVFSRSEAQNHVFAMFFASSNKKYGIYSVF